MTDKRSTVRATSAFLMTGASMIAFIAGVPALAQDTSDAERVTNEIVVTAQRREESIQEVPIAISAFDESRLERLQINDGQDLQLAIPNFQFAKQNFTGSNIAIRGIGTKLVAQSADPAVGIHINGAPVGQTPIFETEFFDVQRVEVLRGPQGTLYGRNASAGVLNIITAPAELETFAARAEGTYGNFNTVRLSGMLNIPVADSFALRFAGFSLDRDGFTEDLTSGNAVDGRDMYSIRASAFAELSDNADAALMVQYFSEDSNRSRIGKQLCTADLRPWPFSQGCQGNVRTGFGVLNTSATLGGLGALIFPGFDPDGPGPLQPTLVSPGVNGGNLGIGGVNPPDLRQVALAVQPLHANDDLVATLLFNYDFGDITFSSVTLASQNEVFSRVDYNQVRLGGVFNRTVFTPTGTFTGPFTGTANTLVTFDESQSEARQWSQEFRLLSDFDGPFDFTLGTIFGSLESSGFYRVYSNSLEAIGLGLGVPQSQWFFESDTDSYTLDSVAVMGEGYWYATDDLQFTLGLRWTADDKAVVDRQTLLQPIERDSAPLSRREAQFDELTGRFTVDYRLDTGFTDSTNLYASYARGYKGGGINPPFDPALFQGVSSTFDPEFINAYEIGAKNVLNDGRIVANLAAFRYDYEGYQISRIVNRTSVNANIDSTVTGLEGEFTWEPVNRLVFDLNIGWLDTEVGESSLIDPANVANSNPAYTNVQDALRWNRNLVFSSGGAFLGTFGAGGTLTTLPAGAVVRQPTVADLLGANGGAAQGAAGGIVANPALATLATAAQCIVPVAAVNAIATINPALLPFACSLARGFGGDPLAGSDGIARNLAGNSLPNTPEWTISFGAQYTLDLGPSWAATVRGDVYHQAESFSRIFNTAGDALDAYTIGSASLRLDNAEHGFYVNLFVRNLTDENVITDLYLTDASSGLFTNAFLLEPRTFGITVGKSF